MKKKKNDEKKTTTSTNPVGRPSEKVPQDVIDKVIKLYVEHNATDQEVADSIGIHVETLRNWKKKDRNFFWATQEAKVFADSQVEKAMFKRAIGMKFTEQAVTKDGVIEIEKYALPDVKAQQFWLKNRQPKVWKDRVELVHEATGKLMIESDDGKEDIDV